MALLLSYIITNPWLWGAVVLCSSVLVCLESPPVRGILALTSLLVAIQTFAAAGVGAWYRWCLDSPTTRALCLLMVCLVSVWTLDMPAFIRLAKLLVVEPEGGVINLPVTLISVMLEIASVVGLSLVIVMVAALLLELPLRWLVNDKRFLEEGLLRTVRLIASVVVVVIGISVMQDRAGELVGSIVRRFGV